MKQIPLTNSDEFALVDDDVFDILNAYRWYNDKGYARATDRSKRRMHSIIMGTREPIDHIDHNGLNNQRSNLRITNASANQHNRKVQGKGVSYVKSVNRWVAYAHREGRRIYLGKYKTEEEALNAKKTFDTN
jgi:hypothetical protein